MKIEITEERVLVHEQETTYEFERSGDNSITPVDDLPPQEVQEELERRQFFIRDYPQTITWRFISSTYDYEEVLWDIQDGVIQEGSPEHYALYNLVAGEYGGLTAEIQVRDSECQIIGIDEDMPIKSVP